MNEQKREAIFEAMRKTDVLVKELGDTVTPAFTRFGDKWSTLIADLAKQFPDIDAAGLTMLIEYLKAAVEKITVDVESEVNQSMKTLAAKLERSRDA